MLVATVIEGAIFITDHKQQLVLKNGHGADYRLCDVCKHKQWKKSFIVRNSKTNYKELAQWVSNVFEADVCSEFDDKIKCVGTDFYMSAGDTAAAFFAIKKYESWKKEQAAKAAGLYIPKHGDYIHIVGKVINKETKSGYFGAYIEYEILNTLDGNTYKRSGAVKADSDNNVDCYAFIRDVFKGQNILDRTTLKAKKGVAIANVLQ